MGSQHPQPTKADAFETLSNPASKTAAEQASARDHEQHKRPLPGDQHIPRKQSAEDTAKPAPLGRGIHGAGPGEEALGKTEEDVGRHRELDAEQMAAPGEGRVAAAVEQKEKTGAGGAQPDLAADLDR